MSINLINYALAKKDWKKAYEDLEVLGVGRRNLIKDSNNFTNYAKFGGATVTFTTGVSVPEWNATDATRIQTSGGTATLKLFKQIVTPSLAGQKYTVSVWVKNIGNYPVVVSTLLGGVSTVNVGEQKRVIITVTGDGTVNVQLRFETTRDNISNPLDFIVWRAKVELGNEATDWTPAPEDIDAHPFVAELAETVFRSKQQDWEKAYEDLKVLGVGGRNLLRNSKGPFIVEPKNTGNASDNYNFYRFYCDMELNETYTISADIEITHGDFDKVTVFPHPDGKASGIPIPSNGRIKYTFVKTSENISGVLIYAGQMGATRGNGIIIRNVKIEKGNKATDWTPAPEDIDAHPFVVELAETVFRSKQNEERIRNLENAITALGGGS